MPVAHDVSLGGMGGPGDGRTAPRFLAQFSPNARTAAPRFPPRLDRGLKTTSVLTRANGHHQHRVSGTVYPAFPPSLVLFYHGT